MYLGIDESNHGKSPEIFTGAITYQKEYILEDGVLKKTRRKGGRTNSFLGFQYKHIIFTKDYKDIISCENYKIISIGEFSKFFLKEGDKGEIFMDGDLKHFEGENILKMLYEINKKIVFHFGKSLDEKIKLVNEADNLANFLYRYYRDSREKNKTKYSDTLLHPNIKNYEKYFI